jgi:putative nucleotidyltransferase with HDIG domain
MHCLDSKPAAAAVADNEPGPAIDSLLNSLESRDPYAKDHSRHVSAYALRLARKLGLGVQQSEQISVAGKVHDIGKLALPRAILNKPGYLTEEEMAKVRQHPVMGVQMLAPFIREQSVLAAIRGHHERFDGQGYPDGLAGEAIPLEARIIAIADCFDALVSFRAYRLPLPRGVALEMIHAGAGTQFDPRLVPAFCRTLVEVSRVNSSSAS